MDVSSVVTSHPDGCALLVWVVPGARRTEIAGLYSGAVRVRIAAPAERGRANRALLDFLQQELGVRLRVGAGAVSRGKRLVAPGCDPSDLIQRVSRALN